VIRRAYRAIVPRSIRAALRSRFGGQNAGPATTQTKASAPKPVTPRRFELPLPVLDGATGAGATTAATGRRSLTIEAPREFYVTRELHKGGVAGYEPETAATILGLADVLRPSVVFDVGANVGPHALLLPAVLDIPVVAFEPSPAVADTLRALVARNDLRCTVEEIAMGEADGTATLYLSPTDVSTSLRPGWREATGELEVPLWTLDRYVATHGLRPNLLKLDTETTEPAVLRGATALLAERPWIICEVFPGWNEAELEGILFPLGYLAYHIDDQSPLRRKDRIVDNTSREHLNWLFAPTEPTPVIWESIGQWRAAIERAGVPIGEGSPEVSA
jgi:FkbM family methyltransferase